MSRRRFLKYAVACFIICFLLPTFHQAANATQLSYRQFQKGMTYDWSWQDTYGTTESDESLRALAATGTNWVALIATWYQPGPQDTSIFPTRETPTDESLVHAIRTIHSLGMRVMLKPHIDIVDSSLWRGDIQPNNVTRWFGSYTNFIVHYARLAQSDGVEQFCVGTELKSMSIYTQEWYNISSAVRMIYNGTVTYASDWTEWTQVRFSDRLDYLGVDVYFPLTNHADPNVDELRSAWKPILTQFENYETFNPKAKPIVFTEIGWMSVAGSNTGTWKWNDICNPARTVYDPSKCKPDMQEQANLYQTALETFWNKPWLQGLFWWSWFPYGTGVGWGEGGPNDPNYSPHNKLAEQVLRSWYAKPFIPQGTSQEAVPALTAIQKAENTTAAAMQDGRTRGLEQAKNLLSQAIGTYNQGDFTRSETLANDAAKSADDTVSQEKYDETATVVNQTLETLNVLRNTTLQSPDAIQLQHESEAEYNSAVTALQSNEFDLAKLHADNATVLAEKALTTEHHFQLRQAWLRQQQEHQEFLSLFALIVITALVSIAVFAVKARRRK